MRHSRSKKTSRLGGGREDVGRPVERFSSGPADTLDNSLHDGYGDSLIERSATVAYEQELDRILHERPTSGPVDELVEPGWSDISERYYREADIDAVEA